VFFGQGHKRQTDRPFGISRDIDDNIKIWLRELGR
jgi:hypothetical protein